MKIIDLTPTIHSDMPVFPGTGQPIFMKANTLEKDGFKEEKITMYSHTGTHMDAPAHILSDGLHLDEFAVDQFLGKATMINLSNESIDVISLEKLKVYEERIKRVEFLIIKTGWSQHWGMDAYYQDFPCLSEEAANWLASFNLKGIGIDAISIDDIKSVTFNVHKILLSRNIVIIENLTNLDHISKEYFTLCVLPMKNKNADGSPVRAVAIEE